MVVFTKENGKTTRCTEYEYFSSLCQEIKVYYFLNNQTGEFNWPDRRKYIGEYKDDKKDGYGEFFWPDGRVYKGRWEKGKQHGKGLFITPEGEEKYGIWADGKKEAWISKEDFENQDE